ncbi:hypothetical protein [Flindersiella endophytica]
MTNQEMQRALQRLQDQLADVSEDMHQLGRENAARLEAWQLARQAAAENEADQEPEAAETSEEGDEVRIEAELTTSALIELLERARPESAPDREVRLRG